MERRDLAASAGVAGLAFMVTSVVLPQGLEPPPPINPIIRQKGFELVAEMRQVAEEKPLVLQSLLRFAEIQRQFEHEHARRCDGRIFCGR